MTIRSTQVTPVCFSIPPTVYCVEFARPMQCALPGSYICHRFWMEQLLQAGFFLLRQELNSHIPYNSHHWSVNNVWIMPIGSIIEVAFWLANHIYYYQIPRCVRSIFSVAKKVEWLCTPYWMSSHPQIWTTRHSAICSFLCMQATTNSTAIFLFFFRQLRSNCLCLPL